MSWSSALLWFAVAEAAPVDDLYGAVSRGDLAGVRLALAAGAGPSETYTYEVRAGMVSRFFGRDTRTETDTPFELALRLVRTTEEPVRAEVLRALLDAGGSVDYALASSVSTRESASEDVSGAARVFAVLEGYGVDRARVLCTAARGGDASVTAWALGAGASVDSDCGGTTPLGAAVQRGRTGPIGPLLDAGASRAALVDGRALFEVASPSVVSALLVHARPLSEAERGALLAGHGAGVLPPEQVRGLVPDALLAPVAEALVARGGSRALIAASEDVGLDGLATLAQGPVGALWAGGPLSLGCELAFGMGPSAVAAALGEGSPLPSSGPVRGWAYPAGDAYFLRPWPTGPARLFVAPVPAACAPEVGALVGQPRSVVRLALGSPELAFPDRDAWAAPWVEAGRGRPGRLVATYGPEGARFEIDWRRP